MPTALYSPAECRAHDMGHGHPESPARLVAMAEQLQRSGLLESLQLKDAPLVTEAQLQRAHEPDHVAQMLALLEAVERSGEVRALDADTDVMAGSRGAALKAAGAAVAATDAVLAGEVDNAFCAVRPPGHHATRSRAMGFCVFNNVVVAARHALEAHGLQRVAIVDFDVHHGNGTEDIVAGDERMLMVGLFQHPLYPHSGDSPTAGNLLNVPLPARSDGAAVRALVEQLWLPRLDAFAPQMVFISAGFDAHREDPLAQLALVEADYAWITRRIKQVAERHAQGRIVSCLEGGYALGALARSVEAHVRVLAEPRGC